MMFRLVPLSGFLGAGKTTTMLAAARLLGQRGHRVAVVTNDQGDDLVDTHLATGSLPPELVGEVTGGCFCCRFEDLAATVRRIVTTTGADTVIAEAVGSCTDLQATVVRPLRRHYGQSSDGPGGADGSGALQVAPLTTIVEPVRIGAMDRPDADPELAYLFERQLAEADIIGLNKVDAHRPELVARLADRLRARYPHARVVPYSAVARVAGLVDAWPEPAARERDVPVDYDRYAAAEARLGWLNTAVRIDAPAGFAPSRWAVAALTELSTAAARGGHLVGHAKLTIRTPAGLTKASLVAAGAPAVLDRTGTEQTEQTEQTVGEVTVNVRMACAPAELDALVERAVRRADQETGTSSRTAAGRAFAPAYPRPVHRIEARRN